MPANRAAGSTDTIVSPPLPSSSDMAWRTKRGKSPDATTVALRAVRSCRCRMMVGSSSSFPLCRACSASSSRSWRFWTADCCSCGSQSCSAPGCLRGELGPLADVPRPNPKRCNRTGGRLPKPNWSSRQAWRSYGTALRAQTTHWYLRTTIL